VFERSLRAGPCKEVEGDISFDGRTALLGFPYRLWLKVPRWGHRAALRSQLPQLSPEPAPGGKALQRAPASGAAIEVLEHLGVLRFCQTVIEERSQSGFVAIAAD
jgi:hypothetical protein